ncbi:MAG: hypothetical protein ACREUD_03905 [Gammaproteobacteria bacterium]
MTRAIENIAAGDASKTLAQLGIAPDKRVTILVDESLADIARRTREEAKRRGMTDEIVKQLMRPDA